MPTESSGILAHARSLLDWHTNTKFCSKCGSKTHLTCGGLEISCKSCNTTYYPRVNPVVIMLVHQGDKCLLGRQSIWAKGLYSTLAGFMEPGESIEEAVHRETVEESGIEIDLKSVEYFGSQFWPFPSSLMLGCFAQAKSTEIKVDKHELEDAKWFTEEEMKNIFQSPKMNYNGYSIPGSHAISHQLIKHWTMNRAKSSSNK